MHARRLGNAMVTAVMVLAMAATAVGCKPKDKAAGQGGGSGAATPAAGDGGAVTATTDGGAAAAPDAGAPAAPPPVALAGEARAEVEAFVTRWLATQNAGDFAAYQALYGERFHGVRRSGKQVRRFDRAGWMKDRAAMFKRPMTVAAAEIMAYAQGDRRQVFFTQTWAQGSYQDVGTKSMVLTGTGAALRVVYEELLASKIQQPTPAAALAAITDTAFGFDRATSVETMKLARVEQQEVILGVTPREVAWVDAQVIDTTKEPSSGGIAAAIVDGDVPAGDPLAALAGAAVTVLDADLEPLCTGTLRDPFVRFAGFLEADDEADAIAKAQVAHDFLVLATLDAPCQGAFVRGAKATALTPPPATTPIADRALTSLRTWEEPPQEGTWEAAAVDKQGWVLVVVHTLERCEAQEGYHWSLHRAVLTGKKWALAPVADGDGDDDTLRLIDLDGDGALDVLTARGAYVGGAWQSWDPDLRGYWPAGLGCDGYEPDDDETVGD